jgi:DNA-binding NarL/FixJ family response regulator
MKHAPAASKMAAKSATTTSVAIVEDHADLRESWAALIGNAAGFRCAGTFGTGEDALGSIPAVAPDVVLMDINLPGMSGIECTSRLKEKLPDLQVIILTVYEDHDRIFNALQAGASGYLLKRTPPDAILAAIVEVKQGGAPMTSEVARKVVQSFRKPPTTPAATDAKLTQREEEILSLLAQGYVTKEIASRLEISFFTAQTHLKNIYEKLHVRSRTEAVIKFLR